MNTPVRSAGIARALASESESLRSDFAAHVAALALAERARHRDWHELALLGAFVAMIGVCVAGWFWIGAPAFGSIDWSQTMVKTVASYPWLAIGVAGVALVQMLTYRRRAAI